MAAVPCAATSSAAISRRSLEGKIADGARPSGWSSFRPSATGAVKALDDYVATVTLGGAAEGLTFRHQRR